jgi:hypothetical protein
MDYRWVTTFHKPQSREESNVTQKPAHVMTESILVAYYPLFLMVVGTFLNLLTFIILCRSSFQDTKKRPTIHYMRAIAVFDIFMLYGWNLQHYLSSVYGFTLETYSIVSCKFFVFFGYFTAQTTGWLRVFVCLDRYLSLHYLHKTWFGHSKNVLFIIAGVVILLALFNLHLMIFSCYYTSSGSINISATLYNTFPLWDYINLGVYNCIPFVCMVFFNSGVIYHLIKLRRSRTIQNSRIQHRSLSITSVTTTFLFLIMTVPASIAFGFFYGVASATLLRSVDASLFTYHVTSFPLYFVTYDKFRRECLTILLCGRYHARVEPMGNEATQTISGPSTMRFKATAHVVQQTNTAQQS